MEAGVIVGVEEAERGVVGVVAVAEAEEVEGAVRETVHRCSSSIGGCPEIYEQNYL